MSEDIAKLLNVDTFKSSASGDTVTYTLGSDNDFGAVYTVLESDNNFEGTEDNYMLNATIANLEYVYKDEYRIELKGNFDSDTYSVTITEKQ